MRGEERVDEAWWRQEMNNILINRKRCLIRANFKLLFFSLLFSSLSSISFHCLIFFSPSPSCFLLVLTFPSLSFSSPLYHHVIQLPIFTLPSFFLIIIIFPLLLSIFFFILHLLSLFTHPHHIILPLLLIPPRNRR